MSAKIVQEIAKKVLPRIVKRPTATQPGMRPQTQRFSQLLEGQNDLVPLSPQELLDQLIPDAADTLLQQFEDLVTPRKETGQIEQATDPVEALRSQFEHGQPTDKRRRTPLRGFTEDGQRQRRQTDEPIVPGIPGEPDLPVPPPPPDDGDIPKPPIIIDVPWPGGSSMPPGDEPVLTDPTEPEEPDNPRFEKDVYDCEEAQKIARMFGLPEPICRGSTGATLHITAREKQR